MTTLIIFLALETFSNNKKIIKQAVANELTRNAKQPFNKIKTVDHWWNWCFNVLLDGLYWEKWYNGASATKSEAGPIGGKFFLVGTPVFTQFRCAGNNNCSLMFLGIIIFNLYLELSVMVQKGIFVYWQEPWNWIEICISMLTLGYYASVIFYSMLAMDIIVKLQKGFFREFVDFNAIIAVEQWSHCLFGFLLFFVIIKLIKLLSVFKMMVPWMSMLRHICVSTRFMMLSAVVFLLAYSSLGYLMFNSNNYTFSSVIKSLHILFIHLLKVGGSKYTCFQNSAMSNHFSVVCFYWTFFIVMAFALTGMAKGIFIKLARVKKVHRNKHFITFTEMISYTKERILLIAGIKQPKYADRVLTNSNNFYLDEFEGLIDELLFHLNAISKSLHCSLPAKPLCYTEEEDEAHLLSTYSSVYIKQSPVNSLYSEDVQEENTLQEGTCLESASLNIELHRSSMTPQKFKHFEIPFEKPEVTTDKVLFTQCSSVSNKFEEHLNSRTNTKIVNEFLIDNKPLNNESLDISEKGYLKNRDTLCLSHCKAMLYNDQHTEIGVQQPEFISGMNRLTCSHSDNMLCKNSKPLKRSHTIVIEPLDCNNSAILNKGFKDDSSNDLNISEHAVPDFANYAFQMNHNDFETDKKINQTCTQQNNVRSIENTITKRITEVPVQTALNHINDNPVDNIPSSLKQCW
ncbi:polycystin-1-like protein 1 [Pelobates fuscus]|uniref:polycystin-1-like protein 1 n=1 Tax=Pelobates fuscus TaxID=191477 RepID=UPI002FE4F236